MVDPMNAPLASPSPRIVIRQSCSYEAPIHQIVMAGWHRLISAGGDNKVRVHHPETGRVLDTFGGFERHVTGIRSLDDRHLLLILTTRYGLLDLENGRVEDVQPSDAGLRALGDRLAPAHLMAAPMLAPVTFSPPRSNDTVAEARLDANHIVYATEDRLDGTRNQYFHVWNVHRGREVRSFWGSDSEVLSLVALDARRVLSSHEDEFFRIWDVETTEQVRRIEHRRGKAGPMALIDKAWLLFAPVNANEMQRLYYWQWGPSDRTLRLWDVEGASELASLQCTGTIIELARLASHRFWARDEDSRLHLIEVQR
jgi:WD40 repeat protein